MQKNISVIVMGYHNMGCIGIRRLVAHNVRISAIITHRDNPKENIWFDSVAELGKSLDVPTYYVEDFDNLKLLQMIRNLNPALIFSFYYRRLIPKDILDVPRLGAINLHGSLLPKYRGRCPVNWQIINGEKESGVTLHYMVESADAGDIIAQKKIAVSRDETALTLFKKLEKAAESLLDEKIEEIASGTCKAIPQDESQTSRYKGRRPEDGKIDWSWPAEKIDNLVRAVTKPYPGAFSYLGKTKIVIWKAEIIYRRLSAESYQPGYIFNYEGDSFIKTGDSWLRVIEAEAIMPNGQKAKRAANTILTNGERLT